jgi:lipoprotein NlpD
MRTSCVWRLVPHRSTVVTWILASALRVGLTGCAHAPIGAVGGKVTSTYTGKGLAVVRPVADEPASPATYVVQKGDTLWGLSRKFNTSVDRLMAANKLKKPQELRVDRRLIIPSDPNKDGPGLMHAGGGTDIQAPAKTQASASLTSRPATPPTPTSVTRTSSRQRYPLVWPVVGDITSKFGQRGSRQHDGIDVGAAKGTPVRVAATGDVIYAAKQGGYGNLVLVRHADGLVTVYAHLDRFTVRKGQCLTAGQLLGYVGETGRASGPHLHFEVRRGVAPENPLKMLPP